MLLCEREVKFTGCAGYHKQMARDGAGQRLLAGTEELSFRSSQNVESEKRDKVGKVGWGQFSSWGLLI